MRAQSIVKVIQHDTGLHPRRGLIRVNRLNVVHMTGQVQDKCLPHRLSGQTCTGSSGQDRNLFLGGNFDGASQITRIGGTVYREGMHAKRTGVTPVNGPCYVIHG